MVTPNSLTYSKGFPCNLTPCDPNCIITCPLFVCWGSRTKNLPRFAKNSAHFHPGLLVSCDNLCFVSSEGQVFTEFWPLQWLNSLVGSGQRQKLRRSNSSPLAFPHSSSPLPSFLPFLTTACTISTVFLRLSRVLRQCFRFHVSLYFNYFKMIVHSVTIDFK